MCALGCLRVRRQCQSARIDHCTAVAALTLTLVRITRCISFVSNCHFPCVQVRVRPMETITPPRQLTTATMGRRMRMAPTRRTARLARKVPRRRSCPPTRPPSSVSVRLHGQFCPHQYWRLMLIMALTLPSPSTDPYYYSAVNVAAIQRSSASPPGSIGRTTVAL